MVRYLKVKQYWEGLKGKEKVGRYISGIKPPIDTRKYSAKYEYK